MKHRRGVLPWLAVPLLAGLLVATQSMNVVSYWQAQKDSARFHQATSVTSRMVDVNREASRLAAEIQREAGRRHKSWSATAAELLEEAIRLRRAPGIVLADGPAGRRAVIAGTGLDVWEIVAAWRECAEDFEELESRYPWLPGAALRGALGYYQLYPDEIDARLALEAEWTPERVARELPFSVPRRPRN